ncbi:hypothetical protein GS506_06975 [Rhodococcus hoagii]|nr:hypothetical protein [Prescottella equi]
MTICYTLAVGLQQGPALDGEHRGIRMSASAPHLDPGHARLTSTPGVAKAHARAAPTCQ